MKAREFLARKRLPFEERDLLKAPLTKDELLALAKKLGGIRELVAPKRRKELENIADGKLADHLAANPNHVRRPLVDTGKVAYGGFTEETREKILE